LLTAPCNLKALIFINIIIGLLLQLQPHPSHPAYHPLSEISLQRQPQA
jgi:hypothetical protein